MILWRNIPPRVWLWRHRTHSQDLAGSVWTCSCGSRRPRVLPPTKSVGGAS